jgi:threonine dehydrogenase-like Zn-dependent dehydrogenase
MGEIKEGETVVVFGCGPVGLFAQKSAWLMGAGRVIAVDHLDYRLEFAKKYANVEIVDFSQVDDIVLHLKKMTEGRGPDVCIGTAMNKNVTMRMGQCNVKRYMPRLIEHIQAGRVDAQGIITHRFPLEAVDEAYRIFSKKEDGCIKAILIPPKAA